MRKNQKRNIVGKHASMIGIALTCMVLLNSWTLVSASECPPYQPKARTTTYEARAFTPIGALPWVRTGLWCVLGHGVGVWQRTVSYSVTVTNKYVSECFSGCFDRFWGSVDACAQVTTQEVTLIYTTTRTETIASLDCSPPPAALPPPFEKLRQWGANNRVDPPTLGGTAEDTAEALEFPDLGGGVVSFGQILSPLAAGYTTGSQNFTLLADTLENICEPPPETGMYVTDLRTISSVFANASVELAAMMPTEVTFRSLGTSLSTFRIHLHALNISQYDLAEPYLAKATDFINDAGYQAGLGLNSDEEKVTFLQDLQSFGASLRAFGDKLREVDVGGIVIPVDKSDSPTPYVGLTTVILGATVATTVYLKRVKRRKGKK
jgi:hypothetical protein